MPSCSGLLTRFKVGQALSPANHFPPSQRTASQHPDPSHNISNDQARRLRLPLRMRIKHSVLLTCLITITLSAADDPFLGKWKVNPSKSKLTDEMKVDALGQNKYVLTFGPGAVDTIVADGTDQPALQGTTLSVTVEGPNNWKVVRKKEGRRIVMGLWTLSADAKALDDDFTAYNADGSTIKLHYVYERTAGSGGFTGTWDSSSEELNSAIELEIQPYQGDGLSFISSIYGGAKNVKLDGRDYPDLGKNAAP